MADEELTITQRLSYCGLPTIAHYLGAVLTWPAYSGKEEIGAEVRRIEEMMRHLSVPIYDDIRVRHGLYIPNAPNDPSDEVRILREYIGVLEDLFSRLGPLCRDVAERSDEVAATARNALALRIAGSKQSSTSE